MRDSDMKLPAQVEEILDDQNRFSSSVSKSSGRFDCANYVIPFRYAAIAGAIIIVLNQLILYSISNDEVIITYIDLSNIFLVFLAIIALYYGAKVSQTQSRRIYFAWITMSLAMVFFLIGDMIFAYIEIILQQDPLVSVADFFYILFY